MTPDELRELIARELPGLDVEFVVLLGEGTDNVAYEVGGEVIVRFTKEQDPVARAEAVQREAAVLSAVRGLVTIATPEPILVRPDIGCLAYRKLPGVPLLHLPGAHEVPAGFAAAIGAFLASLHAAPIAPMRELVDLDVVSPQEWLAEAHGNYDVVAPHVPAAARPAIEAFLTGPVSAADDVPVFCHNDLGIEHILVDPDTRAVTGIIDWADAAIADPAYDVGKLLRDLGPQVTDEILRAYDDPSPALRERALFYARCTVFEDLAYGLEAGRGAYADSALTSLTWLFPQ